MEKLHASKTFKKKAGGFKFEFILFFARFNKIWREDAYYL